MAGTLPVTDPPAAASDGAAPAQAGPIARRLEFLYRLRRAIGMTGFVWSVAAALLGLLSLTIAIVHGQVTREMADVRGNRAVAADIISASTSLNNALIAVLGINTGDRSYAQFHPPLFEWADAAQRLRRICARPGRGDDEFTLRLDRICAAFQALEPSMLPALALPDRLGATIDRDLVVSLTEFARLANETSTAMRLEVGANLAQLRGAQNDSSLLMTLSAGGFIFAGLILFFLVGRSAARHHQMSTVARTAQLEAQASRQQVIDALEAVPVGFALYDRDEHLVLFNRHYSEMLSHVGGLQPSMIGWTLERMTDHLESRLRERYPDRDLSSWKADHLRRCRELQQVDMRLEDGRTLRLCHTLTSSGGMAMIRLDVSDLKQREDELHASQRRFQTLVDSLTDTVFSLNRETRFTYVSASVRELLGYAAEEVRQRSVLEIIHPDDVALLEDVATRLRAHRGVPATFTCRMRRKDGVYRLVEVRLTAPDKLDNRNGEFAMTGVARDVEAQRELEGRLHDRVERLNSIVQSTGALFLLVDRDLRIVMANNGYLGFAGVSEEQIVGRKLRETVNCHLDQAVFDAWLNADESQRLEPVAYDNTVADASGELRTLRVTANPVRGASGRVEHIVFLGVDETERRQTELQLFDASRLATLGEMASGIAHEINQPLTVIRFAAESLQEEINDLPDDDALGDTRQFIDEKCARVVAQTERAATIIRDLRGFARRPDETTDRFDVAQALRTATKMVDEQLRLAHIQLDRDLDPICPPVMGHASRLQQVIINLLLNARDAILERERDAPGMIMIRLRSPRQSGKVVVTVEDDGPGIPDRALPRLFEPFFTTKPTGKGTGLGLSISYQIIRQMGGTIAAENRAEGGARFTITLDAAPSEAAADAAAD